MRSILLNCFLLTLVSFHVIGAETIYFSQTGSGDGSGSSAGNRMSITNASTAGSWDTDVSADGKIGPSDTLSGSGTITNTLSVRASGTSGNPITILLESGAKFSQPAWTNTTGAIDFNQNDFIILDGGVDGIVECTDNGTGLGNQQQTLGIDGSGSGWCEIKRVTFRNFYVRTNDTDTASSGFGAGPKAIYFSGNGNHSNVIHNCTFTEMVAGIAYILSGTSSYVGMTAYSNTFSKIDHCISIGLQTGTGADTAIFGNDFSDYYNWDDTTIGNKYHHNALHIYTVGSGGFTNFSVYENRCHGNVGTLSTSHFYFEPGSGGYFDNLRVFNNYTSQNNVGGIWHMAFGSSSGVITNSICANNTIFGNTGAESYGILVSSAVGNTLVIRNNALIGLKVAGVLYAEALDCSWDYNLYSGNTHFGSSVTLVQNYSTLGAWQTKISGESSAVSTASPLLDTATGYPTSSSSPAVNAGTTLSQFSTDAVGMIRPQGSAWDIGLYEYPVIIPNIPRPYNKLREINLRP